MQNHRKKAIKTIQIPLAYPSPPFMISSQAAQYLGISMSHLYRLTSRHLIAFYKPNGKLNYFKKEDLDAFVLKRMG